MTERHASLLKVMTDHGRPYALGEADREAIRVAMQERSALLEACDRLASIASGQFKEDGLSALAAVDHARAVVETARGDQS